MFMLRVKKATKNFKVIFVNQQILMYPCQLAYITSLKNCQLFMIRLVSFSMVT